MDGIYVKKGAKMKNKLHMVIDVAAYVVLGLTIIDLFYIFFRTSEISIKCIIEAVVVGALIWLSKKEKE